MPSQHQQAGRTPRRRPQEGARRCFTADWQPSEQVVPTCVVFSSIRSEVGLTWGATRQYALAGGAVSPKKAKELEDKAKEKLGIEVPPAVSSAAEQAQQAQSALDPKEFRNFKLKEKKDYNHNTAHFIFELPDGKESGLTVASALVTRSPAAEGDGALLDDKNKPVIRPYTVRPIEHRRRTS